MIVLGALAEAIGMIIVWLVFIILALVGLSLLYALVEIFRGNRKLGIALIAGLFLSLLIRKSAGIGPLVLYLITVIVISAFRAFRLLYRFLSRRHT